MYYFTNPKPGFYGLQSKVNCCICCAYCLLFLTPLPHFASGSSFVNQLPWSGTPTNRIIYCLRLLPCFLLLYWVDILADWRGALSRTRLWPSVPVQNCASLHFCFLKLYFVICQLYTHSLEVMRNWTFYLKNTFTFISH